MRFLILALFFLATITAPAQRLNASGTVLDAASRKPVDGATVMVYSAGVRTGYDQFCPTCYVDCGKRARTSADGKFALNNLAPDLIFQVLVIADGYSPGQFPLDPAKASADPLLLQPRNVPANAVVGKGRVVDAQGAPVRDALIRQQGIIFEQGRGFGPRGWIDQVAVSNANGDFALAFVSPQPGMKPTGMIVEVAPRAMAPRLAVLPVNADPVTLTVRDGAVVRGRLVAGGKPVPNAQFVLATHSRSSGTTFQEIRIGTNDKGEFVITNVPAGRIWDLVPVMDSLASRNLAAGARFVETKDDGAEVHVGDIEARPAFTLAGRIVLSDGAPIPPGMRLSIFGERSTDRQSVLLPPDGTFSFGGLTAGVYTLSPAVKGYRTLDPETPNEILIEQNRPEFRMMLYPAPKVSVP